MRPAPPFDLGRLHYYKVTVVPRASSFHVSLNQIEAPLSINRCPEALGHSLNLGYKKAASRCSWGRIFEVSVKHNENIYTVPL
jgi:hypothetical protein